MTRLKIASVVLAFAGCIEMPQRRTINLVFPVGGYNARTAFQSQPPYTTPYALNVFDVETYTQRRRGGSRPEAIKAWTDQCARTPMQGLVAYDVVCDVTWTTPKATAQHLVGVMAFSGGRLWDPSVPSTYIGSPALDSVQQQEMAQYGTYLLVPNWCASPAHKTDGVLDGSQHLSHPGIADWTALGIDTSHWYVTLYDCESNVNQGVYEISGLFTGYIVLPAAAGGSSSSNKTTFCVSRKPKTYSMVSGSLGDWAAAVSGVVNMPVNCRIVAVHNDRAFLGCDYLAPHAFYMSRAGDMYDWDYSLGDSESAIGGTLPNGAPITAAMSMSQDFFVIGAENSLWVARGDLASGGIMDSISSSLGIVGARALCRGPEGQLFFISKAGLCVVDASLQSAPILLATDVWPQIASSFSPSLYYMSLGCDVAKRRLYFFSKRIASPQLSSGWMYDLETKAFWPISFYTDTQYPVAMVNSKPSGAYGEELILASSDRYLRYFSDSGTWSQELLTGNEVWYGPIRIGDTNSDGTIVEMVGVLGTSSGSVTWGIYTAATIEAARAASAALTGTWSSGKNPAVHPRVRGGAFFLRLSSESRWAVEEISVTIQTGGKSR